MQRHPFDVLSAVFGVLFSGTALAVLMTDDAILDLDARWVWPAGVVVVGLMLILSGIGRDRSTASAPPSPGPPGEE
jgi:hypothetical protein